MLVNDAESSFVPQTEDEPVLDANPRKAFGQLLKWLMARQGRPPGVPTTAWTPPRLAKKLKPNDPEFARKVRYWLGGTYLPQSDELVEEIEKAIFANNTSDPWRGRLEKLYEEAKSQSRAYRAEAIHPQSGPSEGLSTESNLQMLLPEHFLGREDDLAALHASLQRTADQVTVTVVHGMRGVGKSMLATAFARRNSSDYRATWWISAQTETQIRQGLVDLGVRLKWIRRNLDSVTALSKTLQALETTSDPVLLIFDNAISVNDLRPFIPRSGKSRVLITSNSHAWAAIAHTHNVDAWPPMIGAKFLCRRSGRPESEYQDALLLAEALGGLPLALEQAGACCEQLELRFSSYRERFEACPIRLLDDKRYAPADYNQHLTVAKTFSIAIEEAAKREAGAKKLLLHASLLAPDPIPCSLFCCDDIKYESHFTKADFDQALAALRAFALVSRETIIDAWDQTSQLDGFRLHRLIRIVAAAQWASGDDRRQAKSALVLTLADIYPTADETFYRHETWPIARALNGHVASVITESADIPLDGSLITRTLVSLISRFASYVQRAGSDHTVLSLWERNLDICHTAFGDRDDATAEMHNNFGVYLNDVRSGHELALAHYERAYLLRENMRGLDGRTALCAGNMATLLHVNSDLASSAKYYNIAIVAAEACEPNTMFCSSIMSKAATLFADLGDTDKAQQLLYRAGVIVRRERPLSIEMAELHKNQAIVSGLKGDQKRQLSARQESLKVLEAILTPTNWLVISAKNDLCHAHIESEQYREALLLAKLPIRRNKQGHPCDRSVAYAYNAVARICTLNRKPLWAERFYLHALDVLDSLADGPDNDKAQILNNLGQSYLMRGQFAEAIRLFRRTLKMRRTRHRSNSQAVASTLADIGFTYDKLGRVMRATWLHTLAVRALERSLSHGHQRTQDGRTFLMNRLAPRAKYVVAGKSHPTTTYKVTYVSPRAFPVQQST